MKKLLVLVSMAAVVALLVAGLAGAFGRSDTPTAYASRLAGIGGQGVTGINVQNLDPSKSAQIVADFYKQGTGQKTGVTVSQPVPAGGVINLYLPSMTELQNGAYAAIISADTQIAAIARTDWTSTGGAALYSNVMPGTDVRVPLALKKYKTQSSLVSVQNTDPSNQASADVLLFQTGSSTPLKTVTLSLPAGTSQTLDLGKDSSFADVPDGFTGSIQVTSATPMAVQSFVDIGSSTLAVYAFEGVPADSAALKLYAPLFRRNFSGNTGMSIVNTESKEVTLNVTYIGSLGDCKGQTFTHSGIKIAANSSALVYQGSDAVLPAPPMRCGGAAVLEADGKILGIVNDAGSVSGQSTSAAYNAVSDAQGAKIVALPLYRKNHSKGLLTTGIQAMNIGNAPANAQIAFKPNGQPQVSGCAGCSATIPVNGAYTWLPTQIQAVPDKAYGSATITSDQPLVVIVNDKAYAVTPPMDAAIYNGIKADQ